MVKEFLDPRPSAFVLSLRSVGYSLETAVADIIDNSIAAGATKIQIFFSNDENPKFAIIDNGTGMSEQALKEAMRLGSKSPHEHRDKTDLGRFGLGLKTASFAICKRLTVISVETDKRVGAVWDLDEIAAHDSWGLDVLSEKDMMDVYCADKLTGVGTAVIWEKLDRIVDNSSKNRKKDINNVMSNLEKHLSLTFHRYIDGEPGIKKICISINGHVLEAFDPFNKKNPATQVLPEDTLMFGDSKVVIKPYILPHHNNTTANEYDKYAGEGGYFVNQGFYVYRNKRLISHGGWFRLMSSRMTTQLARVQIDISNEQDEDWNIDVKKSVATPPAIVRERLKNIIEKITDKSKKVYKKRAVHSNDNLTHIWNTEVSHNGVQYKVNMEHPLIKRIVGYLDQKQENEFVILLDMIARTFPTEDLISQYGDKPKEVGQNDINEEQLLNAAVVMAQEWLQEGKTLDEILSKFQTFAPFNQYVDDISNRLKKEGLK